MRNSYGTTRIATAGHCPDNSNTFENYSGGSEVKMYFAGGRTGGAYGDFQWHTVNGTEVDDFYYDRGKARDVAAVANPIMDQTICRYGQVTRAACADVQDLSACATWEQGGRTYEACRLVRTDNDISDNGDSGGPWYWGTTAYGIHWGTFGTWLGDRSAFSRATYIDEAIGVQILR